MARRNLACVMLVLALCVCSLPAAAKQTTTYRLALVFSLVFDPSHDQKEIRLGGLNDKGEVAMSVANNNQFRSFVWHEGEIQEVGSSLLLGINDRSVVSGDLLLAPGVPSAFFWRDGDVFVLQALTGERLLFATDVNNRRQALVRYVADQNVGHALWHRGEIKRLDPPAGFSGTLPRRINNRGDIVGSAFAGRNVPAVWQDDTMMQIDTPAGADEAFGVDINDHGTVVAHAFFPAGVGESFGHVTAYVWKDGEITLLPALTSEQQNSTAGSINNRGVVVGSSGTNPGQTFRADATIWRRGRAADLNELIGDEDPLGPFVHLESAEQINNRGQIVATGNDSRRPNNSMSNSINYYLLTPER
jgi:uncharacterized membrane protein